MFKSLSLSERMDKRAAGREIDLDDVRLLELADGEEEA
jgi:hypothetical protein